MQTNIDGVFAGGDVVSGPADVISVVAAGKEAAISIDRYLRGIDLKEGRPEPREPCQVCQQSGCAEESPRQDAGLGCLRERKGFIEVETRV